MQSVSIGSANHPPLGVIGSSAAVCRSYRQAREQRSAAEESATDEDGGEAGETFTSPDGYNSDEVVTQTPQASPSKGNSPKKPPRVSDIDVADFIGEP